MCLTCNPFCGRCITPKLTALQCSSCGHRNVLTRDECVVYLGYKTADKVRGELQHGDSYPACEQCGSSIEEDLKALVVPKNCLYMGVVCGYPCGRHDKERRVGDPLCAKQMPLGKYRPKADEGAP